MILENIIKLSLLSISTFAETRANKVYSTMTKIKNHCKLAYSSRLRLRVPMSFYFIHAGSVYFPVLKAVKAMSFCVFNALDPVPAAGRLALPTLGGSSEARVYKEFG